jgi:radical SAM superfamily enzyme YgiQ (UPF0313 family)
MERILLVRPDFLNLYGVRDAPFKLVRSVMTPLDLATIAGLTPDDIEVDVWDEAVRGQITETTKFEGEYDVVAVTGYLAHARRALKIAGICRQRGWLVVIGGPGVTTSPELFRDHFDVIFLGEGEVTWPAFIDDMRHGRRRKEYRQVTKVDLSNPARPRWDKMTRYLKYYATGSVQTTRGCPHNCEFCDVVHLFGRGTRQKPIDRVLEEVATMERIGMKAIFFCDDNFYGKPAYTKAVLKELIPLNASFRKPMAFSTQITLNITENEEILELLADAGFQSLLIGIETPNEESLAEADKLFNCKKRDMVAAVRKIQSYSMWVRGAMVAGFDHDDTRIFEQQYDFLRDAHIGFAVINPLLAFPGTRLWKRMAKEQRLVHPYGGASPDPNRIPAVMGNMVVKQMPNREYITRFRDMVLRVTDWSSFEERARSMIDDVKRLPRLKKRRAPLPAKVWFLGFLFARLDGKSRRVCIRLLREANKKGPCVTRCIVQQIIMQYALRTGVEIGAKKLDDVLENPDSENPPTMEGLYSGMADSLKVSCRELMAEIHARLEKRLVDKSLAHAMLVEVFTDFLTHAGTHIDNIDDRGREELLDMCNATVARENAWVVDAESVAQRTSPDVPISKLSLEVVSCVEEELIRNRFPQSAANRSYAT